MTQEVLYSVQMSKLKVIYSLLLKTSWIQGVLSTVVNDTTRSHTVIQNDSSKQKTLMNLFKYTTRA